MIKLLSNTIMRSKEYIYSHTALRLGWYLLAVLALLLFRVCTGGSEIAFVYNAF